MDSELPNIEKIGWNNSEIWWSITESNIAFLDQNLLLWINYDLPQISLGIMIVVSIILNLIPVTAMLCCLPDYPVAYILCKCAIMMWNIIPSQKTRIVKSVVQEGIGATTVKTLNPLSLPFCHSQKLKLINHQEKRFALQYSTKVSWINCWTVNKFGTAGVKTWNTRVNNGKVHWVHYLHASKTQVLTPVFVSH